MLLTALLYADIPSSPTAPPTTPNPKPKATSFAVTSPYSASCLNAISVAPKVPAVPKLAILPALAALAQGTKNVTGSTKACPTLPAITPAVSSLPLNSGYS